MIRDLFGVDVLGIRVGVVTGVFVFYIGFFS